MKTLWQKKGQETDRDIMAFTTGDDLELDSRLIPYDIIGSIAHAKGLEKIGILTKADTGALCKTLRELHAESASGKFTLGESDEDCHTAIERLLTDRLGDLGKKIHTARSRNDQVLTALKLMMKESLFLFMEKAAAAAEMFCREGERYKDVLMPGYTHGKRAMPSTLAFWYASIAEGMAEALDAGRALHDRLDSSPLGAAAGFGAPLPIPREFTAGLMGFGRVQVNAQAVQASRGRCEAAFLTWLLDAMRDVEKAASDLLLFSTAEFGFLTIPDAFSTGSSIMPQKKNADVLELLRATPSVVRSCRDEVENIISKLPSGYHRDFQLTKAPLFKGMDLAERVFEITAKIVPELKWNFERMEEAMGIEVFATHRAMDLVKKGLPFRDAYRQAAEELENSDTGEWSVKGGAIIEGLSHTGAPGNPGLAEALKRINIAREWAISSLKRLHGCFDALLVC